MENEALKQQKQDELDALKGYLAHPFTVQIFADSTEEQESLIQLLCQNPVTNIETFFAHFEAIGHLRGLRRSKALLLDNLAIIEHELKALE